MNPKSVLVVEALLERDVVHVIEDGTIDAYQAYYVDGKLIVENPRMDCANLLDALGIKPRILFVHYGFSGDFPPLLTQLKTYKDSRRS